MLAQLSIITRPDRCLRICVCVCVCPMATLSSSGDGWICCSCSQQVLTPEAGPSMSSSPTTPILAQRAGSLPLLPPRMYVCVYVCVCVCGRDRERERTREEERERFMSSLANCFCTYQTGAIQRGRLLEAHHHAWSRSNV